MLAGSSNVSIRRIVPPYTSCEPCSMCVATMTVTGISNNYYVDCMDRQEKRSSAFRRRSGTLLTLMPSSSRADLPSGRGAYLPSSTAPTKRSPF